MFRSVSMAVVGCVAALVLVAAPASAASKSAKSHSMVGTLEKVDGQTLTVKTSSGSESVTLAPSAHITQGGKAIQPSQLTSDTGSHVKVHYTLANGKKQAEAVAVSAPTKTAKK